MMDLQILLDLVSIFGNGPESVGLKNNYWSNKKMDFGVLICPLLEKS